jgi:DNA-binding transcriptional regulator YdaS (Cro superfamily)
VDVGEFISFFRTQTIAASALGLKQPTVAGWIKRGGIPPLRQLQIEKVTRGKLKADRKSYAPNHKEFNSMTQQ